MVNANAAGGSLIVEAKHTQVELLNQQIAAMRRQHLGFHCRHLLVAQLLLRLGVGVLQLGADLARPLLEPVGRVGDQLLDLARGRSPVPFDRSIDVQVSRLRRKIEADPRLPQIIATVRGDGYMLATPVVRT